MNYLYIFIILISIYGIFLCRNIFIKKKSNKPLVCALGADCDVVVRSDFSKFMGISLEIFGAFYYSLIAIFYLLLMGDPNIFSDYIIFIITGMTIGSFLFSLYLIFVQAFYLRSWCSWCIISAILSTLILILTIVSLILNNFPLLEILTKLESLIITVNLIGFGIGIAGATIADILLLGFLRDFKINNKENRVLKTVSQFTWSGLFIVIITLLGLYLPNMEALNNSPTFIFVAIVILIITLNGAIFNLFVSPKMIMDSLNIEDTNKITGFNVKKAHKLRKLSFALVSISFVSWYFAFYIQTKSSLLYSFENLIFFYLLLIIVAYIGGQILEKVYYPHSKK